MAFYDLSKEQRAETVARIKEDLRLDLQDVTWRRALRFFSDEDTYIRKAAYLSVGRLYFEEPALQQLILGLLQLLHDSPDFRVRQTVINAAGEIGKRQFETVRSFFDRGLFDAHHSPRNAVIGSIKKMGEVNPVPVLGWAREYLHHPNKEIRREVCHGIELRGRTHPEDILPLLQELEHDRTQRVRSTLVHVIGQIAYKKGCIEKVVEHLKAWSNKQLVADALEEITDVHDRYRNFSALTQEQARNYIEKHYN